MTNKDQLIQGNTTSRDKKTYNIVTIASVFFIMLTAGFMIFQNFRNAEDITQREVIATAFAEGIQTMCSEGSIRDRYIRICQLAEDYADQSQYLIPEDARVPREISSVTCSEDKTTVEYTDGSSVDVAEQCISR